MALRELPHTYSTVGPPVQNSRRARMNRPLTIAVVIVISMLLVVIILMAIFLSMKNVSETSDLSKMDTTTTKTVSSTFPISSKTGKLFHLLTYFCHLLYIFSGKSGITRDFINIIK